MHTYRKVRDGNGYIYTVGFDNGGTAWTPVEDFDNEKDARALVNYLNGGHGKDMGL